MARPHVDRAVPVPPVNTQPVGRTGQLTAVWLLVAALLSTLLTGCTEQASPGPPIGSPPVGTTGYAVPPDAVFVAPSGDDSASGSEDRPMRTVSAAVRRAADGATVVLRGGSYHESVVIDRPLTVQGYPGEAAWFDGSVPVSGWQRRGDVWVHVGWTPRFDRRASYQRGADESERFVSPEHPAAAWPDQVFADGVQLAQVLDGRDVGPGEFAVDYGSREIVVGSDPTGRTMEATALPTAVLTSASGVVLQGFGVRRYGTSVWQLGAVRIARGDSAVRDVVVEDSATTGLSIGGDSRVERVTVLRSGMLGIHANEADGMSIVRSVVRDSNQQLFRTQPVAGGIKITRTRGVTITGNDVSGSVDAGGVWLDESVVDFTIAHNSVVANDAWGIQVELAATGVVASNEIIGGRRGLYLYGTGDVRVYNNHFAGQTLAAVFLSQDERRQATHPVGRDPRAPVPDPTCPWILTGIDFSNNLITELAPEALFQYYVLDKATGTPADAMDLRVNGNVFAAAPTMVGWGGSDDVTVDRYPSPEEFARGVGRPWRNTAAPGPRPGAREMASLIAAATATATPLPRDVAAAVGAASGSRHVGPLPLR